MKRSYLIVGLSILFVLLAGTAIFFMSRNTSTPLPDNFELYEGKGFSLGHPQDVQIREQENAVLLSYGNEQDADFIALSLDLRNEQDSQLVELVKNKDCTTITQEVIKGFGLDTSTLATKEEVKTINGKDFCVTEIKTQEAEAFIYLFVDSKDRLYTAITSRQQGQNDERFANLNKIVETIQVDDNYVVDKYDYLNDYNNMSTPQLLSEEDRINKKVTMATDKGVIEIELFGSEAPLTVSNFISLSNDGFYNGLTFHRREEGFVIQGGDPVGNGTGGPGYKFRDEPVTRDYERGIVAMANSGPNTNGSQFFIMLADTPLPKNYTIFGKVTSGLEVVDQIQVGDKMTEVKIGEM